MEKVIKFYKTKEDMKIGAFFKEIIIFEYQLDLILEWYKDECYIIICNYKQKNNMGDSFA